MYIVFWWDAQGKSHLSEELTKEDAEAFAARLNASQEPNLVFINRV